MMLEARDRFAKPIDIGADFVRQRSTGNGVFADSDRDRVLVPSLIREGSAPVIGSPGTMGGGSVRGRTMYAPAVARRQKSPARSGGRDRGFPTNSALPCWYPRIPLRDITDIMRAIERRRAQLRETETEGQELHGSSPEITRLPGSSPTESSARLEHTSSTVSPIPTTHCAPFAAKVPKMTLHLPNQNAENSECLTPQKQLLNSIDEVEKAVKQELQTLKRTPTAKKAEREKRVRTLMSMR